MPKPTCVRWKKGANPLSQPFLVSLPQSSRCFCPCCVSPANPNNFFWGGFFKKGRKSKALSMTETCYFQTVDSVTIKWEIFDQNQSWICSFLAQQQHWPNPSEQTWNVQTKKWQQYLGCLGSQWTKSSTDLGSSVKKKTDGKTKRDVAVEKREWKSRKIWSLG